LRCTVSIHKCNDLGCNVRATCFGRTIPDAVAKIYIFAQTESISSRTPEGFTLRQLVIDAKFADWTNTLISDCGIDSIGVVHLSRMMEGS
jgi:hypothetical protein